MILEALKFQSMWTPLPLNTSPSLMPWGTLTLYQQQTGNEDAQLTHVLRLGAGACAGIIAMSATYPTDMVHGRLPVQTEKSPYQYRRMFHALSTVLREEGPQALYKGWLPSVIGVIPYVGLNFAVYESLKDWLIKSRHFGLVEDIELSVTTWLACGAVAGTVGQTVAYPLDVIRCRMQMVGWSNAASVVTGDGRSKAPLEYTSFWGTLVKWFTDFSKIIFIQK